MDDKTTRRLYTSVNVVYIIAAEEQSLSYYALAAILELTTVRNLIYINNGTKVFININNGTKVFMIVGNSFSSYHFVNCMDVQKTIYFPEDVSTENIMFNLLKGLFYKHFE